MRCTIPFGSPHRDPSGVSRAEPAEAGGGRRAAWQTMAVDMAMRCTAVRQMSRCMMAAGCAYRCMHYRGAPVRSPKPSATFRAPPSPGIRVVPDSSCATHARQVARVEDQSSIVHVMPEAFMSQLMPV